MEPSQPATATRGTRLFTWVLVGFVALSLLGWWWLHRSWFIAGDDFFFVTQYGAAGGRFGLSDFARGVADDWNRRNGRLADAVVRLVLRPGEWFYPLFAPIMLTGAGLAAGWLANRGASEQRTAWVWAGGLLVIPWVLWREPMMTGDAVFWASAGVNYVLSLALLLVSLVGMVSVADARAPRWAATFGWCVVIILTDVVHESTSLAMVLVALTVVVATRGRLSPQGWTMVGAAGVIFLVHVNAGGLWNRFAKVSDLVDEPTTVRLLHDMANSSLVYWSRTSWLWLVMIVFLVAWVILRRGGGTWSAGSRTMAWSVVAAGVSLVVLAVAASCYREAIQDVAVGRPLPASLFPQAIGVSLAFLLAVIVVGVVLFLGREVFGVAVLLAWVAMVGAAGYSFGAGATGPRGQFLPMTLMVVALLCLTARAASRSSLSMRTSNRVASVCVLVLLAVPAALWFDSARVGLHMNREWVDRVVAPQIEAARSGELKVIVIPKTFPSPGMSYGNSFRMPSYEKPFKIYYELPDSVSVVNE